MKIIAHRGLWKEKKDQNTLVAFKRAFDLGFGVELDVRDSFGHLVVSHDPTQVSGEELQLKEVLELFAKYDSTLAINIKSDGLIPSIQSALTNINETRYFLFDMSIPETIGYLNSGLRTFMRISEFEEISSLHEASSGIWLDAFNNDWWTSRSQVFQNFKSVCVVSPELHGRAEDTGWKFLRGIDFAGELSLCTDYPEKASRYFG
jgi:glycerophosphoryl diester phosphodiesterase